MEVEIHLVRPQEVVKQKGCQIGMVELNLREVAAGRIVSVVVSHVVASLLQAVVIPWRQTLP